MGKHGKLFVSWLKFQYLDRNMLRSGRVVKDEKVLEDAGQRVRDLRESLNGLLLYVRPYAPPGQLPGLVSAR